MGFVDSASNDPIFPLHHSFLDRIYEKWLRKYNKDGSVLYLLYAPIGHNKHDLIVPFFPLCPHQQMVKKSFEFGYEYEHVDKDDKYFVSGGSVPLSLVCSHLTIVIKEAVLFKGPLIYLLMPLLGKNQLAVCSWLYTCLLQLDQI